MSKRKTKAEDVKNPENYFNRYIALEIQKGKVKDKKYNELFCPLEIILSGGNEKILNTPPRDGHFNRPSQTP